jgi:hypothetical protein
MVSSSMTLDCTNPCADAYVVAFHRWLERFGGGGPWGPPAAWAHLAGPRQGREQLLDRWATKN